MSNYKKNLQDKAILNNNREFASSIVRKERQNSVNRMGLFNPMRYVNCNEKNLIIVDPKDDKIK